MKKAFLFIPALLAISISPFSHAHIDKNVYVYGDSISDTGNTKAEKIKAAKSESSEETENAKKLKKRFTTDGDDEKNYAEWWLGRWLIPSEEGGTNYARGGAVAIGAFNPEEPSNTTDRQVNDYLKNNKADPNGIYIHWVGGNDIKVALIANQEKLFNLTDKSSWKPDVMIKESANAAATQINALVKSGAGLIIAPTVPDVGTTPKLLETVLESGIKMKVNKMVDAEIDKMGWLTRLFVEKKVRKIIQDEMPKQIESVLDEIHLNINQATLSSEDARQLALQKLFVKLSQLAEKKVKDMAEQYKEHLSMAGIDLENIKLDPEQIKNELSGGYDKASTAATILTDAYNKRVDDKISESNGNILRADVNGLLREVMSNPLIYGFGNNLGYACGVGIDANKCTSKPKATKGQGPKDFDDSKEFIFSDGFHPSPLAHKIMGQYIESIYIAPSQVMTLNLVNRATVKGSRSSLDGHLQQLRNGGNEQGKFGVFGAYTDNRHNSFTLGGDYQLTENFLLGALYTNDKSEYSPAPNFTYNGDAHVATGYALWNVFNNAWLSGDLHYAHINYDSLTRNIQLGKATRRETGSTKGKQWGVRLAAGWDIPVTDIVSTSPIIQFAWDKGDVKGYRESGNNSTSMHFSDQNYTSKVGTLGWRVDSKLGRFNPYASVEFNHQFGDTRYKLRSAIHSTKTSFVMESGKQSKDWRQYTIGTNANLFDDVRGFASVTLNEGRSQDPNYNFSLGINISF